MKVPNYLTFAQVRQALKAVLAAHVDDPHELISLTHPQRIKRELYKIDKVKPCVIVWYKYRMVESTAATEWINSHIKEEEQV